MTARARVLHDDVDWVISALAQMDWAIDRMMDVVGSAEIGEAAALEADPRAILALLRQLAHDCSVMTRVVARLADANGESESSVRRLSALAEQLGEGARAQRV